MLTTKRRPSAKFTKPNTTNTITLSALPTIKELQEKGGFQKRDLFRWFDTKRENQIVPRAKAIELLTRYGFFIL